MPIENNRYKMEAAKAAKILRGASAKALALVGNPAAEGDGFLNWFAPAELGVRAIFGEGSTNHRRFAAVPGRGEFAHEDEMYDRWQCLKEGARVLDLFVFEVETFWDGAPAVPSVDRFVSMLEAFPRAIAAFSKRGRARRRATIKNEYELQRWLRVVLSLQSDDIRPEEPTPSHVGASARMDFFLPDERLAVEAKMARETLTDAKIGDELLVDVQRYKERTDCDALVCFVYDPHGHVINPAALKKGIEKDSGRLTVRAVIAR